MNRILLLCGCSLALGIVSLAQTPQATELPGKPFAVVKTWTIGGEGNWDYLTLDPSALQLYIPHGNVVQVVTVDGGTNGDAGKLAGQVTGLREAHSVALDDQGQFGYVSDGAASQVFVFDRHSFETVAKIPTAKNPRAVVFDPSSRLVFVICPDPVQESRITRRPGQRPGGDSSVHSTVTVIDTGTQKRLADLVLPGRLGFAQADGHGRVYVNVTDRDQIASFNAATIEVQLHKLADAAEARASQAPSNAANAAKTSPNGSLDPTLTIDWSDTAPEPPAIAKQLRTIRLGADCQAPRGLAIDGENQRLFAACDNMKLLVLDLTTGLAVASLPIGAGTDAVGYDPDRGLIYASNGGGVGSLTIIRRHETDSYAVIQELPTQARARTLAVNPANGEVYLVTNVVGFDLTKPAPPSGGIGSLKQSSLAGSFQVLVVGN